MTTALIVGDVQTGITKNYPFSEPVVEPISRLLPRARAAGHLVVFVRTALRPSGADVRGNALFTAFHGAGEQFHEGSTDTEVDARLRPEPDDVVVLKRRTSAFAGTDLDLILRAQDVDSLVLTGVATSAMVAATLYDAADRDYSLEVVADACADFEPEVHRFFVDRVFPGRGANVVESARWASS